MTMWFENAPGRTKRPARRRRRRPKSVTLQARTAARKKPRAAVRVAAPLGAVVAAAAVCLLLWFGLRALGHALYADNPAFVIRELDVQGGALISETLIREYTQIEEGRNLFDVDIDQVRHDFLARAPSVRSMEISRRLPDCLRIRIDERTPLARFGWRGPLVIDRHGVVFAFSGRTDHLPVIANYRGDDARPGARLSGMCLAALEVLEALEEMPSLGLDIEAVEVDNRDYLMLRLRDRKAAKLAWKEMGAGSRASRRHLLRKLGRLVKALSSEEGRRLSLLDATLEGRIYGR